MNLKSIFNNNLGKFSPLLRRVGSFLPLILLIVAILMVRHLLSAYTLSEIIEDIKAVPLTNILLAFALTILNYIVLTFYDYLGSRYVRSKIPIRKIALASFIAYAFSQNLGASVLSGGAVRYRFYQREGLSPTNIAKLIAFTAFHFWLGLFLLAGSLAILKPESFSELFHVSTNICRLTGIAVLAPSIVYIFFLFFPKILARKYRRFIPKKGLGLLGIFVCVFDWVIAASVFCSLLYGEHNITIFKTMGAFIAAQVAGVLSHVPGGLGVFEATVAYILSPHHDNAQLLTTLIIFRFIYYFLPFILSILLMTTYELTLHYKSIRQNPEAAARFAFLGNLFNAFAPIINTLFCLLTGLLLMSSSTIPSELSFSVKAKDYIPLAVFEISHFLSSILGVILIFVGIGLRRRSKDTYQCVLYLLLTSFFLSIGENHALNAILIFINLSFLYFTRKSFYRSNTNKLVRIATRWDWAIGVSLLCIMMGFFSYKEIEYDHSLWLSFTPEGDASRFLRSILGMLLGLVACIFYFIFSRTVTHAPNLPEETELKRAEEILELGGNTGGYLSLSRDKELLYSDSKDAFLMWRVSGGSAICFSDPQGNAESYQELTWKFRELTEDISKFCVFYEISPKMIPNVLDLGLRVFKIGEEGVVNLNDFSLNGSKVGQLRTVANKMKKEGVTFSVIEKSEVHTRIEELKAVSDEWLSFKNTSEKGFSLGFFEENYIQNFRCGVVEKDGKVLGFANILESKANSEISIDLMRHSASAPNGVMDFLFTNLFLWGKENDYQAFSLGMSPLSGLSTNPLAPNYAKLGNLFYRHGGHFYNFEGLRKYKEKFNPTWIPRYLACSNGLVLPIVLSNISVLISGGVSGLVKK